MINNPYFTIWFRPVRTINNVLSDRIDFNFRFPILFAAISMAFGNEISEEFGFGFTASFIILLLLTGLTYTISAYFSPWWIMKIGKIWNGKSKFKDLQLVFGLAYIPITLILIYQLLSLSLGDIISDAEVNYGIQVVVWIFYIRILIIGIAKSQGFTYGLAIVNLVISIFPFIILKLMID